MPNKCKTAKKKTVTKKRALKTLTLCDKSGEPTVTLCKGHVDASTFTKATKAEGWSSDPVEQTDLSHEYWVQNKEKRFWKKSTASNKKAVAVTVTRWY